MADSKLAGEKRISDSVNRYVIFSDDELLKKIKLAKNPNIEASERKAHKVFTKFLT